MASSSGPSSENGQTAVTGTALPIARACEVSAWRNPERLVRIAIDPFAAAHAPQPMQ